MEALSRRGFLRVSTLATAATVAAACVPAPATPAPAGQPTAAPAQPTSAPAQPTLAPAMQPTAATGAAMPSQFSEAPMLAERVAAGELPPVDERLPENPGVYPCYEMIGEYGGTLRRGFTGVSDRVGPSKVRDASLTHYNPDLTLRANLAEGWESNEDGREWTIALRRGTRWSDGEPLTSADFLYHWEHVVMDADLNPAGPSNPYTVEAIDDHTVRFTYEEPYPLFAYANNRDHLFQPGHYMRQFHKSLADDPAEIDRMAAAEGLDSWTALYSDRNNWYMNPERPDITPWLAQNQLSEELFIMERNPYFFAIDPEGAQLPYIDRITHRLFEQPDVFNLWILNGEIDWQSRHVGVANYTLLNEGKTAGGYEILMWRSDGGLTLSINHDAKTPRVREFFNDVNVRKGLNVAVDRETINEIVYDGLMTPRQASPSSFGPYYIEEASRAYAHYDPDEANAFLDEAGYAERGADGFRLWKDGSGEQVFFVIEGTAATGSPDSDAVLMLIDYFAAVGVNCTFRSHERSLYEARWTVNDVEAAWWGGGHYTLPFHDQGGNYFTGGKVDRPWAGGWGLYHVRGDVPHASTPPEGHWLWQLWEWYDIGRKATDDQVRIDMHKQIMDVWIEQVPVVGVLGEQPALVVVKNGVRNIFGSYWNASVAHDEGLLGAPTLFWEDPAMRG